MIRELSGGKMVELVQWNVHRCRQMVRLKFPVATNIHDHRTTLQVLQRGTPRNQAQSLKGEKYRQNQSRQ